MLNANQTQTVNKLVFCTYKAVTHFGGNIIGKPKDFIIKE